MSRKEHQRQIRRVEGLFKAIESGEKVADILVRREQNIRRAIGQWEVGNNSEQNVSSALLELPEVASVTVTPKGRHADSQGIDLKVSLNRDKVDAVFRRVHVQVRSSRKGIKKFKEDRAIMLGLSQEALEEYLKESRLIVLNGRLPSDIIRQQFLDQLQAIIDYNRAPIA